MRARKRGASAGDTSAMLRPAASARAVRPARCTYTSTAGGICSAASLQAPYSTLSVIPKSFTRSGRATQQWS